MGTGSLGWAILDDERLENAPYGEDAPNPIDCGVIVFPEGMERDERNNLSSPAAERRKKRAARRLILRRKRRKMRTLGVLIEAGMCPLSREGLAAWKNGHYPIEDKAFMAWLASTPEQNPYVDRKRAAEGRVDPLCLGRALYHIAQRRGFKSSKKEQMQELLQEEVLAEGGKKPSKKKEASEATQTKQAIDALSKEMGERTLGQYFYDCFQNGDKIRGRRTGRLEHYEKEFKVIMARQGYDETSELYKDLHFAIFFQRPLRIQRHLVGWCTLDKGKPYLDRSNPERPVERTKRRYRRCLISHPDFEYFRALCFLNNLRLSDTAPQRGGDRLGRDEGHVPTPEERAFLLEKLTRKTACKVKDILPKKHWSNYRPSDDAPHMEVRARLSALEIPASDWQTAFNALIDFDDPQYLLEWAKKRYAFDDKQARAFVCINPSTDRAQYSLHAIRRILPYLEQGMGLRKAIFCANLDLVIPDFEVNRKAVLEGLTMCEAAYAEQKERRKTDPRIRVQPLEGFHYRTYLEKTWGMKPEDYARLYVDILEPDTENKILPPVDLGSIRNPLACRALTVLRRLINTLRAEGKIDADTHINIELARNVNSANECRAIEKFQLKKRDERATARKDLAEKLLENGVQVAITDELLMRYQLWKEQDESCPYTGCKIGFKQMLTECDIEHTIPRARGGTDAWENLTLCDLHYNRNIKKNRLPSECPNATEAWCDPETGKEYPALFNGKVLTTWCAKLKADGQELERKKPRRGTDPEAYANARQTYLQLQMEYRLLKRKVDAFSLTADCVNENGFIPRQMVDTGIMTRHAVRFLKCRYPHVHTTNGSATAYARKAWGIQAEDEVKDRSDHIHHAVDAAVIAALDTRRFQEICIALGKARYDSTLTCPPPYPNFSTLIHQATEAILIRHLPTNRIVHPFGRNGVRGSLHKDTLYGRILVDGKPTLVVRKILSDAKNPEELRKWADCAADRTIGACLRKQLDAYIAQGVPQKQLPLQPYWLRPPMEGRPGIPIRKIRVCLMKTQEKKLSSALLGELDQWARTAADIDEGNALAAQLRAYRAQGCKENELPTKPYIRADGNTPMTAIKVRKGDDKGPTELRSQAFGGTPVLVSGETQLRLNLTLNAKGRIIPEAVSVLKATRNKTGARAALPCAIFPGTLILIYRDTPDELYRLPKLQLAKRLYVVRKFKKDGRLTLWKHREATRATELEKELVAAGKNKEGASSLNFDTPERLLFISLSTYLNHILIENVHFRLTLDGQIEWLSHD